MDITTLKRGERIKVTGLSDDEYHQSNGLSSTQIKDAMQSLMYFDKKYNQKLITPATTDHFCIGNLVHCMVLQPEHVANRFVTKPDIPKATVKQRITYEKWVKEGKPAKNKYPNHPTDTAIQRCEFWDNFSRRDITTVTTEQWALCENMAKAIKANPIVENLLSDAAVEREQPYYAMDNETKLLVKAKPDIKLGDTIADIKSIGLRSKVDEEWLLTTLRAEVLRRNYHISAAMYLDVTNAKNFYCVFVNKEPHYHWVAVVQIGQALLDEGYERYHQTLRNIKTAIETDEWPDPLSTRLGYDVDSKHYIINTI